MSKEKIKYVPKKWQDQVKLRYEELSSKGWDWRSFWNGALEGFYLAYLMGLFSEEKGSCIIELEKNNLDLTEAVDKMIEDRDYFNDKMVKAEKERDLLKTKHMIVSEVNTAMKCAVISALKGLTDYEGLPASKLNFLQVISKTSEELEKLKQERELFKENYKQLLEEAISLYQFSPNGYREPAAVYFKEEKCFLSTLSKDTEKS